MLNAIKSSNGLSVLTLNCQSLSAKFDELCIFLNTLEHKLDIITLQETWCCEMDQYKLYEIKDYNYSATCAKSSKHGGLITYIHKDYKFKLNCDFDDHSNLWESHFLEIAHKTNNNTSKTIIVGNLCRPPKLKNVLLSTFINEFSSILNKIPKKKSFVYICGDFNIDLLKIREKRLYSEYFDNLLSEGFHPKISLPTLLRKTSRTLIDNIITNSKDFGEKSGILIYKISDHLASFANSKPIITKKAIQKHITIEKTSKDALNNVKTELQNCDVLKNINQNINSDVNSNYRLFEESIISAKTKHMHTKTVRFNKTIHKQNSWMTDDLLKQTNFKNKLYKQFKQTPPNNPEYERRKINLETCKRIYRRDIDSAKKTYYFKLFHKYKTDMKQTWSIINNFCKINNKEYVNITLKINETIVTDTQVIVDKFNIFFSKIGDQVISELEKNNNVNVSYKQYLTNPTDARFQFEEVSVDTTTQLISKLKSKDTKGHDLISNNLLKAIKHEIVKPLTFIINQSLKTGTFPDRLKVARVRPLFKKGDNQLITNYRPISILPSLSKIFEKVMHMQLTYYLESNTLMATTQYGYRRGHSTELASLELEDRIYGHLENNDIPCAVFCDLSKAFDCLSHPILLDKLDYYGIRGIPFQLIKTYLQNRIQFVQINSTMSTTTSINIGIPQGSVLGPLFFNICINDIKNCTNKFDIVSYADDTTLITTIDSFTSLNTNISDNINSELENVNKWLAAQKLCLNVLKTKHMMVHTHKNVFQNCTYLSTMLT